MRGEKIPDTQDVMQVFLVGPTFEQTLAPRVEDLAVSEGVGPPLRNHTEL